MDPVPTQAPAPSPTTPEGVFWLRLSAWVFDTTLAGIPAAGAAWALMGSRRQALEARAEQAQASMDAALAYVTDWAWLYAQQGAWTLVFLVLIYGVGSVVAEGGHYQSTWGKRLVGLTVAGMPGRREDHWAVAARFAAGALSWASLNIGHGMAYWRDDGRALHDLVAGMRVVREEIDPNSRKAGVLVCWATWLLVNASIITFWPVDPVLEGLSDQMIQTAQGEGFNAP